MDKAYPGPYNAFDIVWCDILGALLSREVHSELLEGLTDLAVEGKLKLFDKKMSARLGIWYAKNNRG